MKAYNDIEESKIILGDCLRVMDELPAYAFSLILTDPPYLFTKRHGKDETQKTSSFVTPFYDYGQREEVCLLKMRYARKEIFAWLDKTPRLMRKYNAYIFCSEEQIGIYQEWAVQHRYKCAVLVWEKPITIINKQRFSQNVEYIIRIYENGTRLNYVPESNVYGRVLRYAPVRKRRHPTEKPLDLLGVIVRLSSKRGEAVLDPFCGSASTYEAAIRQGRKCVGIEKYEPYYKTAKERAELCRTFLESF